MKYIEQAATFFLLLCICIVLVLILKETYYVREAIVTHFEQFEYEVESVHKE